MLLSPWRLHVLRPPFLITSVLILPCRWERNTEGHLLSCPCMRQQADLRATVGQSSHVLCPLWQGLSFSPQPCTRTHPLSAVGDLWPDPGPTPTVVAALSSVGAGWADSVHP